MFCILAIYIDENNTIYRPNRFLKLQSLHYIFILIPFTREYLEPLFKWINNCDIEMIKWIILYEKLQKSTIKKKIHDSRNKGNKIFFFCLFQHKRHHYITAHRHESTSTVETTKLPQNSQDAVVPPTPISIEDDYFGRSEFNIQLRIPHVNPKIYTILSVKKNIIWL